LLAVLSAWDRAIANFSELRRGEVRRGTAGRPTERGRLLQLPQSDLIMGGATGTTRRKMIRRVATLALTAVFLSIGASTASADVPLQEASCQGGKAATGGTYGEGTSAEAGPGYGGVISEGADDKCLIATGHTP
jgi:hypothetical protein